MYTDIAKMTVGLFQDTNHLIPIGPNIINELLYNEFIAVSNTVSNAMKFTVRIATALASLFAITYSGYSLYMVYVKFIILS